MKKNIKKNHLEDAFAEDFSTPLFPLLADIYLAEGDIKRAAKVCEIGLSHDEFNTDGNILKKSTFNSDGSLDSKVLYTYNSSKKLVAEDNYIKSNLNSEYISQNSSNSFLLIAKKVSAQK